MNPDEESNYQIAKNHFEGKGYTIYYSDKNKYIKSAFHATFPVFTYEFLIENDISKKSWIIFYNVLSALLFGISIVFFYKLCLYFLDGRYAVYATFTYCIFPSIFYYIGGLFCYENIATPLIIIICFLIIKSLDCKLTVFENFIILLCAIVSILYRAQTIVIFTLLFFIYSLIVLYSKIYTKLILVFVIAIMAVLVHIPILNKNYRMFNAYILSTQTGFELLQGHNPTARGSWMGNWKNPENPLYIYVHKQIPQIDNMNQYQESIARKELAIRWAKENPLQVFKLYIRKIVIYFLPYNYEVLPTSKYFNPLNFIVYCSFLVMLCYKSMKMKFNASDLIILSPIIASLSLTIIFFMGARWRYYAEPFMIIYSAILMKKIIEYFSKRYTIKLQ